MNRIMQAICAQEMTVNKVLIHAKITLQPCVYLKSDKLDFNHVLRYLYSLNTNPINPMIAEITK